MPTQSLTIVVRAAAAALEELRSARAEAAADLEVWVERESATFSALFGDDRCFLMFLRDNGDAGFSSRNLELEPDDAVTSTFTLSNGQVDELPLHWTHPAAVGWAALERFVETGRLLSSVSWSNDSGDGTTPPL